MKKIILIISINYLLILSLNSQSCVNSDIKQLELVKNGSFEEYTRKATWNEQLHLAKHWFQLPDNLSTADYRHQDFDCDNRTEFPPNIGLSDCLQTVTLKSNGDYNPAGEPDCANMKPKEGKGIGFLRLAIKTSTSTISAEKCDVNNPNILGGEYILQELAQPLIAGKTYNVKFFAQLADESPWAYKEMSIFFTKTISKTRTKACPIESIDTRSIITKVDNNGLRDRDNWFEVSGSLVAEGGEKFLTIGVINPQLSKLVQVGSRCPGRLSEDRAATYGIDAVSVTLDLCNQPEFTNNQPILVAPCIIQNGVQCPAVANPTFLNATFPNNRPWTATIFNATKYTFQIWNRLGNKRIDETGFDPCGFNGKIVAWFGRDFNGTQVASDVYVFVLKLENCNTSESKTFSGEIAYLGGNDGVDVGTNPFPYECSCPSFVKAFLPQNLSQNCLGQNEVSFKNITSPTIEKASVTLNSYSTTINSIGGETKFTAGYRVILDKNFTVNKGSNFFAGIDKCNISTITGLMRNINGINNGLENINKELDRNENLTNSLYKDEITQINILKNNDLIQVFPNPTSSELNISFKSLNKSFVNLSILNTIGQIFFSFDNYYENEDFHNKTINIEQWVAGTYFIKYQVNDKTIIKKITKI